MRLVSGLMHRHGLTVVVAAIAVIALWVVRHGESPSVMPELSPAQSVALRFVASAGTPSAAGEQMAARQRQQTTASHLTFSPGSLVDTALPDAVVTGQRPEQALVYAGPALGDKTPTAVATDGTSTAAGVAGGDPAADPAAAKDAGLQVPPVNRNAAFSDGQITSIKERLNLTAAQEPYWPPVEAALRALVWQRPLDKRTKAAVLDPAGVQRLTVAAIALTAHLTQEQKREVRTFALLLGLDKIASQL